MSDMSRPVAPPHASDHERHDALLVAQSTAGDPLSEDQLAEARAARRELPRLRHVGG